MKSSLLLLLLFLLIPTLTLGQSPNVRNTGESEIGQQLKRYNLERNDDSYEQGETHISYEHGMPASTVKAIADRTLRIFNKYRVEFIDIASIQPTRNAYLVEAHLRAPDDAPPAELERCDAANLVFSSNGEELISQVTFQISCSIGYRIETHFIGSERALFVYTLIAMDGALMSNYVIEFTGNRLRFLGDMPVFDRANWDSPGPGAGKTPMRTATAEYRNNTYYITMTSEDSLWLRTPDLPPNGGEDIRIATENIPIPYFFNGKGMEPTRPLNLRRLTESEKELLDASLHMKFEHQEVIRKWLASKPGWLPATVIDAYDPSGDQRADEFISEQLRDLKRHPFYIADDFNRDGVQDFVLILRKWENRKLKYAVAIFNGPFNQRRGVAPTYYSEQLGQGDWLFWFTGDKFGSRIIIGAPATDSGHIIRPRGRGYVVQ